MHLRSEVPRFGGLGFGFRVQQYCDGIVLQYPKSGNHNFPFVMSERNLHLPQQCTTEPLRNHTKNTENLTKPFRTLES